MSLFSRFFGAKAQGGQRILTTLDLAKHLEGEPSAVTPGNAMQSIAILRCVTLLSGLHASFPVDVMRKSKGRRESIENHPLDRLFNGSPNSDNDCFQFREMMMANLLLSGNACAIKVRSNDRIIGLEPIQWDEITWQRKDSAVVYRYNDRDWSSDDIFRVSLLSLNGIHGLSPINQCRARLSGHVQAERLPGNLYRNKPMPGVVLTFPGNVSPEMAKQLREAIEDGFTGDNQGRAMVLGGGPTTAFPTIPLTDLQYVESLGYGEEQIARLYGVPPVILGITTKSTSWGTGIEQQNIGFAQYTLTPTAVRWEKAIWRQLLTEKERADGYYVKHNLASMFRGDSKSQAETLALYHREGAVNSNEMRAFLDMNGYPGGDAYVMQGQMTPVDQLGKAPAPAVPAGGAQ